SRSLASHKPKSAGGHQFAQSSAFPTFAKVTPKSRTLPQRQTMIAFTFSWRISGDTHELLAPRPLVAPAHHRGLPQHRFAGLSGGMFQSRSEWVLALPD